VGLMRADLAPKRGQTPDGSGEQKSRVDARTSASKTAGVDGNTKARLGLLGAAWIAPAALIRPARAIPDACVLPMAARDATRARAFARRHGIPRVHQTYEDLIKDPELDAVCNPLPNSLHAEWTIRALRAGKHVLCEKPMASNAAPGWADWRIDVAPGRHSEPGGSP